MTKPERENVRSEVLFVIGSVRRAAFVLGHFGLRHLTASSRSFSHV